MASTRPTQTQLLIKVRKDFISLGMTNDRLLKVLEVSLRLAWLLGSMEGMEEGRDIAREAMRKI